MPRSRDYRSEYQKRNDAAKALGFRSYSAYRRALESGKIVRSGNSFNVAVPSDIIRLPRYKQAGFNTTAEYNEALKETKQWLKDHAKDEKLLYAKDHLNNPIVLQSVYKGWVKKNPLPGERAANIEFFLTTATGFYSTRQWKEKYAKRFKK